MTTYAKALDNSKTTTEGLMKDTSRLFTAGVATNFSATSLQVKQRTAGANMSVDVEIGDAFLMRPTGDYGFWVWQDAASNVTISTSNPSNPRIDAIVAWVDTGATNASLNNSPGSLKFSAIAGTPAGSPSAPTDNAIQTALGASVAWTRLANVTVGAGATNIVNANIADQRSAVELRGTKFYDQPLKATPSGSDIVPIRDVSANADKRTTVAGLATPIMAAASNSDITSATIVTYKEVTTGFNSGGAGAWNGTGINALNTTIDITKAGDYEVSLLLPAIYPSTSTTQWYVRARSTSPALTFIETTTGNIAINAQPTTFFARRRMPLSVGSYSVEFQWYGSVAGSGNPINCGCSTNNPATFIVKAV